jgi:hypothetical protein
MEYQKAKDWLNQNLMLEMKEFRTFFNQILSEEDSSEKLKAIAYSCMKVTEKWEPDFRATFTRIKFLVDEKYGTTSPFRKKEKKSEREH